MTVIIGVGETDTRRETCLIQTVKWSNHTSLTDEICTKSIIYHGSKIPTRSFSHLHTSAWTHTETPSTLVQCLVKRQWSLWVNAGPGGDGSAAATAHPTRLLVQSYLIVHFVHIIAPLLFRHSLPQDPSVTFTEQQNTLGGFDLSCTGLFLNMRWVKCKTR